MANMKKIPGSLVRIISYARPMPCKSNGDRIGFVWTDDRDVPSKGTVVLVTGKKYVFAAKIRSRINESRATLKPVLIVLHRGMHFLVDKDFTRLVLPPAS